mmetsp:Transcript_65079/g.172382  ORF Transcript_65079/g.172382 Transcript_65079/m.172382 type:complete len:108 (-) Transcript_65079:1572-1895(-)
MPKAARKHQGCCATGVLMGHERPMLKEQLNHSGMPFGGGKVEGRTSSIRDDGANGQAFGQQLPHMTEIANTARSCEGHRRADTCARALLAVPPSLATRYLPTSKSKV